MADPVDAPTGCIAPPLGSQVQAALGEQLPSLSPLAHHAETCLACALERRAWQRSQKEPAAATNTGALLRRVEVALLGSIP